MRTSPLAVLILTAETPFAAGLDRSSGVDGRSGAVFGTVPRTPCIPRRRRRGAPGWRASCAIGAVTRAASGRVAERRSRLVRRRGCLQMF